MTLDAELAPLLALLPERDYGLMPPGDSRLGMRAVAALRELSDDGLERTDLVGKPYARRCSRRNSTAPPGAGE